MLFSQTKRRTDFAVQFRPTKYKNGAKYIRIHYDLIKLLNRLHIILKKNKHEVKE